jgi:MoaA/NifB/PqqE/SkfB family radical SAM enzyme
MTPLVVVWRITERCNLACPFCAFDRTFHAAPVEVGQAEALGWIRLLGALRRETNRPIIVSFLGGEPLAWPHLRTIADCATSLDLHVSLTTNGLKLTQPSWQDWALSTLSEITVSIDGLAPVHDAHRGAGHFARSLSIVRGLRARRASHAPAPRVKVNTLLLRENIESFARLASVVAEAGVEALTFNDLGGRDRPEFHPDHCATALQMATFVSELPRIQLEARRWGLEILGGPAYLHRLRCSSQGIRLPIDECHPGDDFWFVDAQGNLSPCSFTGDAYALPIRELQTVEGLLDVPRRLAALRRAQRHPACADCRSTQVFSKFEATRSAAT